MKFHNWLQDFHFQDPLKDTRESFNWEKMKIWFIWTVARHGGIPLYWTHIILRLLNFFPRVISIHYPKQSSRRDSKDYHSGKYVEWQTLSIWIKLYILWSVNERNLEYYFNFNFAILLHDSMSQRAVCSIEGNVLYKTVRNTVKVSYQQQQQNQPF